MKVLTAEEMRAADKAAMAHYGIPSVVLMENAALAVVRQMAAELGGLAGKRLAVFCGSGNNGGDGFAIARHLFNHNAAVRVFMLADEAELKGDALVNYRILQKMGVELQGFDSPKQVNVLRLALINCSAAVDAMLGTGLKGAVSPIYAAAIEVINGCGAKVFAVDIPSGLDADNGTMHGACVKADITVTFAYPKLGMVLPAALPYVGRLHIADIGIPQEVLSELAVKREWLTADFCRRFLPKRRTVSHKGDYGTMLLLSGSEDMPGAAALAAKAALCSGVGRVQAALPASVRSSFASQVAEATLISLPKDNEKCLAESAVEAIHSREYDVLALGMGIGREERTAEAVKALLAEAKVPCVVDADALYALCGEREFVRKLKQPLIFTPHEGEFARLINKRVESLRADAINLALDFAAEWNVVLVLKRACTLIATPDGRLFINPTGNPGMATAGSGDVLSGIIAALLAQRLSAAAAAAVGVYLHGLAGDIAAEEHGEYALCAGNIIENIHIALKETGF